MPVTLGSDDEASSAATTLRTPPATDQVISESTGSGVDSTTGDADSTADVNQDTGDRRGDSSVAHEQEMSEKVYILRCTILEKMIDKLDKLDNVGGVQAIPFMQVIHLLTMDLDGSSELGQRVMYKLLTVFIKKLEMVSSTPASEVRKKRRNGIIGMSFCNIYIPILDAQSDAKDRSPVVDPAHVQRVHGQGEILIVVQQVEQQW